MTIALALPSFGNAPLSAQATDAHDVVLEQAINRCKFIVPSNNDKQRRECIASQIALIGNSALLTARPVPAPAVDKSMIAVPYANPKAWVTFGDYPALAIQE